MSISNANVRFDSTINKTLKTLGATYETQALAEIDFGQVDREAHPCWTRGCHPFVLNSKPILFDGSECVSKFAWGVISEEKIGESNRRCCNSRWGE